MSNSNFSNRNFTSSEVTADQRCSITQKSQKYNYVCILATRFNCHAQNSVHWLGESSHVTFNLMARYHYRTILTLPFPSLLVPTPFTKGRGGRAEPPASYLKNRCPHEREILQGIRDTFESLRNVKVVYIVFTWLP